MKRSLILLFALIIPSSVFGDVYIYPNKGQSQEQQSKDRYECHTWSVQQTGFDPTKAQAAPAPAAPQRGGEVVKGAARGAIVGTVGGAVAGNTGKGAAAGAAMGGLLGGMRKMDKSRAQQQQQAQAQNNLAQQQAAYTRALGACLEGRGYTVK